MEYLAELNNSNRTMRIATEAEHRSFASVTIREKIGERGHETRSAIKQPIMAQIVF
jgi:hypothetical protein